MSPAIYRVIIGKIDWWYYKGQIGNALSMITSHAGSATAIQRQGIAAALTHKNPMFDI
jgi:hypothetical protein